MEEEEEEYAETLREYVERLVGWIDCEVSDVYDSTVSQCFITAKQDMLLLLRHSISTPKRQFPTNSSTLELPDDMILEVMSRCSSLDALASFKASCKFLNRLAYDARFTASLPIFSGFIQRDPTFVDANGPRPDISMDFLPVDVEIKACSDTTGFVFCISELFLSPVRCYLCKPTTKEWLQIPNPGNSHYSIYGLDVMSLHPFHFKILRLTELPDRLYYRTRYACDIYDSKTPHNWRNLNHLRLKKHVWRLHAMPVTVHGRIHFLADDKEVMAFDTITENWTSFSLYPPIKSTDKCLMKYKGKLAMLFTHYDDDDDDCYQTFWVMEDYHNKVWIKKSYHQVITVEAPDQCCLDDSVYTFTDFEPCPGCLVDYDLASFVTLFNELWRPCFETTMYLQSDFIKTGCTLGKENEMIEMNAMDHVRTMRRDTEGIMYMLAEVPLIYFFIILFVVYYVVHFVI